MNLPAGLTLSTGGVLSGTPATDGSLGTLAVTPVSDTALLVTIPVADIATEGILRIGVTTPAPGGGLSNEGQFQVYGPEPQVMAVTNAASLSQGTVAPGEVVAIFGLGLGPDTLTVFDPSSPPHPDLAGFLRFGNQRDDQWNTSADSLHQFLSSRCARAAIYHWGRRAGGGVLARRPRLAGVLGNAGHAMDPGIFSVASSGHGQGAILNLQFDHWRLHHQLRRQRGREGVDRGDLRHWDRRHKLSCRQPAHSIKPGGDNAGRAYGDHRRAKRGCPWSPGASWFCPGFNPDQRRGAGDSSGLPHCAGSGDGGSGIKSDRFDNGGEMTRLSLEPYCGDFAAPVIHCRIVDVSAASYNGSS